ncbi:MAG: hypothetical protein COC09_04180 [Gammaproteobacteria bacterium]|nr:hypothetical protein [Gammaproteobacteria bacterium]PCH63995.1 MAG: hypothetical protein COC09_04180 [Gammaproteobacteria bacterium]
MNINKSCDVFVVWHPFQQRAHMLSKKLGATLCWFSYGWEKKNLLTKLIAYVLKSVETALYCVKNKPRRIFVQLPPVPLLYVVNLYRWWSGCQVVYDCHNSLFCSHWIRWPLVRSLLHVSNVKALTHNEDIAEIAVSYNVESLVLIDPLPDYIRPNGEIKLPNGLIPNNYIIVPFSFSDDEPVNELFEAARNLPEIIFVITWFKERAQAKVNDVIPENIIFTGYLDLDIYKSVFANSMCALALTTREGTQPSVATEAIGFGVPLLVSDIKTTRKLYDEWPIYVENSAESIVDGIKVLVGCRELMLPRMQRLYSHIDDMHKRQFSALLKILDL